MRHLKTDNNVFFYHHPCIDGSASAWVASKKFDGYGRFVGVGHHSYEDIFSELSTIPVDSCNVFFLDYAPPRKVLEKLASFGCSVTVCDHHQTALEDLKGLELSNLECFLDTKKSGAGITWALMFPKEEMPVFLKLIENIDINNSSYFSSMDQYYNIAAFFDQIPLSSFADVHKKFNEISSWSIDRFETLGIEARKEFQKKIDSVMQNVSFIETDISIPVIHVNLYDHSREFVPYALKKFHADSIIMWHEENHEQIRLNIHSCNNVSAKNLAEKLISMFGGYGGGHEKSAVVRFSPRSFKAFCGHFSILEH